MFNDSSKNLTIAQQALNFTSIGLGTSFHEEEGHDALIKDYKNEADHVAENREPFTDETSFSISVSNDILTELTVPEMVEVLCQELDRVTVVFRDLVQEIPEESVNRVKEAVKACETLYGLIYHTADLTKEEIDLIPPVCLDLDFSFEAQEHSTDRFAGTINVSLSIVSTGSLDHLNEGDPFSSHDDDTIVNAPIEWFFSNIKKDFKPFGL